MEKSPAYLGSFAALACLLHSLAAFATQAPNTPHQIIYALADRIYVIGETTGSQDHWTQAEDIAAQQMRDYIATHENADALNERDENQRTPLMTAAYLGYAGIVEVLLQNRRVVSAINDADAGGLSAWTYANIAFRQSILACNPKAARDPFVIVPILVTQPYYLTRNPYRRTRELLQQAGAQADMGKAKELWQKRCREQSGAMRLRVAESADLLDTVVKEGEASLSALFKQE